MFEADAVPKILVQNTPIFPHLDPQATRIAMASRWISYNSPFPLQESQVRDPFMGVGRSALSPASSFKIWAADIDYFVWNSYIKYRHQQNNGGGDPSMGI